MLGGALGFATWLLPLQGFGKVSLIALGLIAVAYALHQFRLIRMPYPQRRAQVPHDARVRFPMWQTGLLYGFALGMNFLTYVRTPILYLVVLGALVSGSVYAAIILFMALNLGRFLPLLVNLLPMHDWTVQRWLASNEHRALTADAVSLSFTGAILLVLGLA